MPAIPYYYQTDKPKLNKKLAKQEAITQPLFDPIDLLTSLVTGGTYGLLKGGASAITPGVLGQFSLKGATKMGIGKGVLTLAKKGWPFALGLLIGSGGKKKEQTPTITPKQALPNKAALTQEEFQNFVDQINSILGGNIPVNKFSQQAADLATGAIPALQQAYAPLIKQSKKGSQALLNLAQAIPLVATQGPSYYDTGLLDTMGQNIQRLMALSQPTDMNFGSLLRAKYARRALQTALPTYASLVSAGRTSVTPSSVVPNLMASAYSMQLNPQLQLLQAIPSLTTAAQGTLRTIGAGQQAKATMLLNTLLGGQGKMDVATLNALSRLGALDPAVKDLILQNYAQ